eukprot:3799380-Heterocapsa_arctica.AAC.1
MASVDYGRLEHGGLAAGRAGVLEVCSWQKLGGGEAQCQVHLLAGTSQNPCLRGHGCETCWHLPVS